MVFFIFFFFLAHSLPSDGQWPSHSESGKKMAISSQFLLTENIAIFFRFLESEKKFFCKVKCKENLSGNIVFFHVLYCPLGIRGESFRINFLSWPLVNVLVFWESARTWADKNELVFFDLPFGHWLLVWEVAFVTDWPLSIGHWPLGWPLAFVTLLPLAIEGAMAIDHSLLIVLHQYHTTLYVVLFSFQWEFGSHQSLISLVFELE